MKVRLLLPVLFVCFIMSCSNNDTSSSDTPGITTASTPAISYTVAAAYPHDTASFTQGLEFYKGQLLEGTGQYGSSKLRQINLATGKPVREIALPPAFFGEGITILNDTLYQLTYKEKKVFVYSAADFKKINEFALPTEGWGLTNNGNELIVTDGSSNLFYYNPTTFQLLRTQGVTEGGSPVVNLNELEYINGFIYANQFEYPYIVKIDPASGQVVGKMDFSDLVKRAHAKIPQINPRDAVLNGIAHNPETDKIYITGKYWPEIYEVQFAH